MNTDLIDLIVNVGYIFASVLFILGIKYMGSAATARRGNQISSIGMLVAVVVTLLNKGVDFKWIVLGLVLGGLVGGISSRVIAMTTMPEMVALFNGFGGISSLLVAFVVYLTKKEMGSFTMSTIILSILIGGITFTGSLVAWGKLSGKINGKAIKFTGQQFINILILIAMLGGLVFLTVNPSIENAIYFVLGIIALSFIFGVMAVIPIGGADMPVVISLLNSYSGLAACTAGFAIGNNVLIVSGALVGASGIILTKIMCKAMNRSLANVLFSGFSSGKSKKKAGSEEYGEAKSINAEDAFMILEAAKSVVIVPGYGMAVAQAQHVVKELSELLEENDCEVNFGIHPVAGRMPGHMNVLLAEANVPYEQLREMDDINPEMPNTDVAIVIGANDVVNPGARDDESSDLYGMPIIDVDKARTVFVLKRSMSPGYAGVQNPLFFKENTRMLFGDAKSTVQALVSEFKSML